MQCWLSVPNLSKVLVSFDFLYQIILWQQMLRLSRLCYIKRKINEFENTELLIKSIMPTQTTDSRINGPMIHV